jgi:GAF domain-containing protein
VQEVCQNVAAYFNDLVRAYRTALFLIDNQRKQVIVKVKHGYFPTNLEEMTYEVLNAGLTGMVLRSGKPILSVSADDGIEPTETIEQRKLNHIGALIVVPITVKGEVIGTVTTLNQDDGRLFTQHDVDLLMSLAAQTSQAIENVRLLEQTQIARRQAEARVQEMDILNRVSRQVSSTLDLDQVLDTLCAVLAEEMKFTSIQLNLIDPLSRTVQIARALGLAQGRQGLVRPLAEMQNDILLDIARKGQLEVIDGPD